MHRKIVILLATEAVVAVIVLAGCSARSGGAITRKAKVGVILPDSRSSTRWETADRRYLEIAFKAKGLDYEIQNAQGDRTAFQNIADQMIADGVNVLIIISQDSPTGKEVLDRARSQGVATIDYDRLTLGGSASYHVSFDNTNVGELLAVGLVKCLADAKITKPVIAELNGAPTDDNSTLLKNGYDSVLKPLYASGKYLKGPDEWVPYWENGKAATIFAQMLDSNPRIAGVLAANDGLANAAIMALRKEKLNGQVPVTGQDATVQGLQNILLGDQCLTVYKDIRREANAAADLAVALIRGEQRDTGQTRRDPTTGREVPSVLLKPVAIYKSNIENVIMDGFVTKAELCAGNLAPKCTEAGIR